ncbi:hypothetical protein HZS_80 [Henneguya salminicola]|nr:hypothetical protein HZS_80 [Henneguya salminicola]
MVISEKKRVIGKSHKKLLSIKYKSSDGVIEKLDNKIRSAKTVHYMVKRICNQHSLSSRLTKMEKFRNYIPRDLNLIKKYLQYSDPIVVFSDDNIPIALKKLKIPEKLKPTATKSNPIPLAIRLQSTPAQKFPANTLLNVFDQGYRLRYRISTLYKSIYDLLPCPSLFAVHANGKNEASKFLQEIALEKMECFNREFLDYGAPKLKRAKANDGPKICIQCQTDFSSHFTSIDSKKTKFLCEKCVSKKKRCEAAKLDILALYSPSLTTDPASINMNIMDRRLTVIHPPKMVALPRKNDANIKNLNVATRPPISEGSNLLKSQNNFEKVQIKTSQAVCSNPQNISLTPGIPRLIVHSTNSPRIQNFNPVNSVGKVVSMSGPIPTTNPQHHRYHLSSNHQPVTSAMHPVFVPFSTLNSPSCENMPRINTTIHYRPQYQMRISMNQTPILRENLSSNNLHSDSHIRTKFTFSQSIPKYEYTSAK